MARNPPTLTQLQANQVFIIHHYELITELAHTVWGVKRKPTCVPTDIDDFVQQVFLKLLVTSSSYIQSRGKPNSYIYTVAYSCFIDYIRKQNSLYPSELNFHTTIEELMVDEDSEDCFSEPSYLYMSGNYETIVHREDHKEAHQESDQSSYQEICW